MIVCRLAGWRGRGRGGAGVQQQPGLCSPPSGSGRYGGGWYSTVVYIMYVRPFWSAGFCFRHPDRRNIKFGICIQGSWSKLIELCLQHCFLFKGSSCNFYVLERPLGLPYLEWYQEWKGLHRLSQRCNAMFHFLGGRGEGLQGGHRVPGRPRLRQRALRGASVPRPPPPSPLHPAACLTTLLPDPHRTARSHQEVPLLQASTKKDPILLFSGHSYWALLPLNREIYWTRCSQCF